MCAIAAKIKQKFAYGPGSLPVAYLKVNHFCGVRILIHTLKKSFTVIVPVSHPEQENAPCRTCVFLPQHLYSQSLAYHVIVGEHRCMRCVYDVFKTRLRLDAINSRSIYQQSSTLTSYRLQLSKESRVRVGPISLLTTLHRIFANTLPLVRILYPLEKTPGIISLLAGKPNASTFPFTSISFTARSPGIDSKQDLTLRLQGAELEDSLQYSELSGIKPLLDWIYGLQEIVHGRKRGEGWRVSVGAGSQDLIYKVRLF